MDDRDVLEHGITARCSWLTDTGMDFLHDLDICLSELNLISDHLSDSDLIKLKRHENPAV